MPKKRSRAEIQRDYRQRRDADPQRREVYLQQRNDKYIKDLQSGKRKLIGNMNERERAGVSGLVHAQDRSHLSRLACRVYFWRGNIFLYVAKEFPIHLLRVLVCHAVNGPLLSML